MWQFTTETTGSNGELVHFTLENRTVSGSDYLVDLYADIDGSWQVGSFDAVVNYNSSGLRASDYHGNNLSNFDSGLSGAGYTATQGDYAPGQISISIVTTNPTVYKTSKFKVGTFKLKILDDSKNDDLSFNSSESAIANNMTQLTYGCSTSSCWNATTPTTKEIGGGTTIGTPTLTSPSNNATSVSTTPAFDWSDVSTATSYNIEVSTTNAFTTKVIDTDVSNSNYTPTASLTEGTTYYWRANATDGSDVSSWSNVWQFTTENSTLLPPSSWDFTDNTGHNATIIIENNGEIDFSDRDIHNGDAIGVFYKDGSTEKCAGYGIWNGGSVHVFTAWGDNTQTLEKDGFASSEIYTFKMWDSDLGEEFYATQHIKSGSSVYQANGITTIDTMKVANPTLLPPSSWDFTDNTGNNATIIIENSGAIDFCERDIHNGDAIGVFYKDGSTEICAGYGIWDGASIMVFAAWGDDSQTIEKDGFNSMENYTFKMWDSDLGEEFYVNKHIKSGNSVYLPNTITRIDEMEAICSVTQSVIFINGWNIVSSYVTPENDSLIAIVRPIADNMVIAKNNLGKVYLPQDNHFDQIGKWELEEGYLVYITQADTLEIEGDAAAVGTSIDLINGWNLISYLFADGQDAVTALANISDNVIIVKNNLGKVYLPQDNHFNQIGDLVAGEGYLLYIDQADNLVYPDPNLKQSLKERCLETQFLKFNKPSFKSATLMLSTNLPNATEIGAYNQNDELVGSGVVENGMAIIAIFGDDEFTNITDGAKKDEKITFKMLHTKTQYLEEITLTDIENVLNGDVYDEVKYKTHSILRAKISNDYSVSAGDIDLELFPNPAKLSTELHLQLDTDDEITIELYNATGKLMQTVYTGKYISNTTINTSNLESGLYQIIVHSNDEIYSVKLIIEK